MDVVTCPHCSTATPFRAPGSVHLDTCQRCHLSLPPELFTLGQLQSEAQSQAPVFAVRPYTPAKGKPFAGILPALVVGVLVACVVGVGVGMFRPVVYSFVVLVQPLYGAALGGSAGLGAAAGKARRVKTIRTVGCVVGLVGLVTLYYGEYQMARSANAAFRNVSFGQFLTTRPAVGVRLFDYNLGEVGSVVYWVVEAIVIVGAATIVAGLQVSPPFCDGCRLWKRRKTLGRYTVDAALAVRAAVAGQPGLMVAPGLPGDEVTVQLYKCPRCEAANGIDVHVSCSRSQSVGATRTVSYPPEAVAEFARIHRACEQRQFVLKQ